MEATGLLNPIESLIFNIKCCIQDIIIKVAIVMPVFTLKGYRSELHSPRLRMDVMLTCCGVRRPFNEAIRHMMRIRM